MTDAPTVRAWWCERMPVFAAAADRFGWAGRLDAAAADIANGTPIADAIAAHRLPLDPADAVEDEDVETMKGADPTDLSALGVPGFVVRGSYRCPATPACGRAATADPDTGRAPRCWVTDRQMVRRLPRFGGRG
ncbi:hypothetical protein ACTMTJ_17350 [Phytohabitans sp. LJ34]|uniref:hypothetical protein n=1 Tax=Phytohabitans sp. LJ34 TaxID=3452217 RepID=UPI003F88885C